MRRPNAMMALLKSPARSQKRPMLGECPSLPRLGEIGECSLCAFNPGPERATGKAFWGDGLSQRAGLMSADYWRDRGSSP
jgi:hypothetical protein